MPRAAGRVGADGLRDSLGRDGGARRSGVARRCEGDVVAVGLQPHGERVNGGGQAHVGRAVGVDVIAQHQRAIQSGEPAGDSGDVGDQVKARAARDFLVAVPTLRMTRIVLSDGNQ